MTALTHLRVLELTHMVSGPYAGMLLADVGAETIKIESPDGGDMTRGLVADDPDVSVAGFGPYFLALNRNKKSLTLNLKSDAGRQVFYDLVRVSDIVLSNYRAGVATRLGVDHGTLQEINPRIITCSITGFGETGPATDRPSYDMVAQALSGVMSLTGAPDGPPVRAGIPIADLSAAMMAVIGILAAVAAREQSGRGQHVDISMLDVLVSMLTYYAPIALRSGVAPERLGSGHFHHVPYEVYPCRDGHLILGVVTDEFWRRLVEALPIPELDTDENRWREGRLKNRPVIDAHLTALFQTDTRAAWLARLEGAGVPCAPVNDILAALTDPQIVARNMVANIQLETGESAAVAGNAMKLSRTPGESFAPPPRLGGDSDELLRDLLGKTEAEIEALRAQGAI